MPRMGVHVLWEIGSGDILRIDAIVSLVMHNCRRINLSNINSLLRAWLMHRDLWCSPMLTVWNRVH